MKMFKVTFADEIKAENLEDAYDQLRLYLSKCDYNGDITTFKFEEIDDDGNLLEEVEI